MKFSFSWLKKHLDTPHSIEAIAEKLTDLGLEVDGIDNAADTLRDFKVGHILTAEKHPDADKLQVCTVDTGDKELLTVVCGAPNARKDLKVVFAAPGVTIPSNGLVLKVAKVRGVESHGMLCSGDELCLRDNQDGIMELPADAPVGQSLVEHLTLDDPVVEIALTPNRGDCLAIRGIARDLAAAGMGTLKDLEMPSIKGTFQSPITVVREFSEDTDNACPHFTGRYIRGVKNGPSPQWLQNMMQAVGLKSISALADVTNFFSQDLCRPLHVFDADTIADNQVIVRLSKAGETVETLDEETYTLDDQMTVIADPKKIISIGGVMGSLETGCSMDTTNVFLEAAYFDPVRIAKTGRKLNILSDARYRFERGIDPESTHPGLDLATQMIVDLCGGEVSEVVEAGTTPTNRHSITFPLSHIERLTGVKVDRTEAEQILTILGCSITKSEKKSLTVETPSWRHDLKISEDLVEEVLRVKGYHEIPITPLPDFDAHTFAPLAPTQQRVAKVRHLLANRSMMEIVSWSMVDAENFKRFGGGLDDLRITNPITKDLEWMRPSLLPQLLNAVKRNLSRGLTPVNLFEVGPTYFKPGSRGQETVAGGVRNGKILENHWKSEERNQDLFDIKNDTLAVLKACGVNTDKLQILSEPIDWMHPHRCGIIMQGPKNLLGYFGEIYPPILKAFGIKSPVMAFEIYLSRLAEPKIKGPNKGKLELSQYQAVERDLAFIVDADFPAKKLLDAARKAGQPLLQNISVFDAYMGPNVDTGKKSLAIRFSFQSTDHTLTEEEINTTFNSMIKAIETATGGVLRDGT